MDGIQGGGKRLIVQPVPLNPILQSENYRLPMLLSQANLTLINTETGFRPTPECTRKRETTIRGCLNLAAEQIVNGRRLRPLLYILN